MAADRADVDDVAFALAPMPRRCVAWSLDAALGIVLAAIFAKAAGGEQDLRTIWHLVVFKSVNGPAGQQLSDALRLGDPDPSALRSLIGLTAIIAVIAIGSVAYRVITTARWGSGIGKMLLGMRVVVASGPTAGDIPGWGRSWKRWAVPQLPGLIPLPATGLLAYLPAFKDALNRGLHDRAGGTVVIRETAVPAYREIARRRVAVMPTQPAISSFEQPPAPVAQPAYQSVISLHMGPQTTD